MRAGIDTGGTFTDVVWLDGGVLKIAKVPSSPDFPSRAVLNGLRRITEKVGLVCHGTTVGTNAVLSRTGGPSGLVVNDGFTDIPAIGHGDRSNLYSPKPSRTHPLIPGSMTFGINARFDESGEQIAFPAEEEYNELLEKISSAGLKALGVGLLHSAAHPKGESLLARILEVHCGIPVFASAELSPYPREYERWSLACMAAYLAPVLGDYIGDLRSKIGSALAMMTSSGGLVSPEYVLKNPALCVLSGPAGGALAALGHGRKNVMALDMGGTSTDVTLLAGKLPKTRETEIDGHPLPIPAIDIHTIGAGGGSLVSFDKGGMLSVGPGSAGADPGPACYGKGGPACLSDVALLAGRIVAGMFLGGRMPLDPGLSKKALERIKPGSMSQDELIDGVIELTVAHLTGALRKISVARGIDPSPANNPDRVFSLMPFGGAGALFAVECARALGLKQVIHPRASGVFSAVGLLSAPLMAERERTVLIDIEKSAMVIEKIRAELKQEVDEILDEWHLDDKRDYYLTLECRYSGQSHAIEIQPDLTGQKIEVADLKKHFEDSYSKRYAYLHTGVEIELVTIRLRGEIPAPLNLAGDDIVENRDREVVGAGTIELRSDGKWVMGNIYHRERLPVGVEVVGPAVIVENFSTFYLPPDASGVLDEMGSLIVEV